MTVYFVTLSAKSLAVSLEGLLEMVSFCLPLLLVSSRACVIWLMKTRLFHENPTLLEKAIIEISAERSIINKKKLFINIK